nr:unnamed protein product [Digitaria exilis]
MGPREWRREESASPIPYREGPLEYSPAKMCDCGEKAARWISGQKNSPVIAPLKRGRPPPPPAVAYARCLRIPPRRRLHYFAWERAIWAERNLVSRRVSTVTWQSDPRWRSKPGKCGVKQPRRRAAEKEKELTLTGRRRSSGGTSNRSELRSSDGGLARSETQRKRRRQESGTPGRCVRSRDKEGHLLGWAVSRPYLGRVDEANTHSLFLTSYSFSPYETGQATQRVHVATTAKFFFTSPMIRRSVQEPPIDSHLPESSRITSALLAPFHSVVISTVAPFLSGRPCGELHWFARPLSILTGSPIASAASAADAHDMPPDPCPGGTAAVAVPITASRASAQRRYERADRWQLGGVGTAVSLQTRRATPRRRRLRRRERSPASNLVATFRASGHWSSVAGAITWVTTARGDAAAAAASLSCLPLPWKSPRPSPPSLEHHSSWTRHLHHATLIPAGILLARSFLLLFLSHKTE